MELNFNLHTAQMKIFNSSARFRVVAAGRRFGKSYLSAVELLIAGLRETNEYGYNIKDKEVWYIAPTFQQAKDIMWSLLKSIGKDVIKRTIENTGTIHLINGRTIQLKGSDRPDTLRGVGISFVVMDEYAFMKPAVWEEIIRPTLADVKGAALFIGTPEGKNHFYDLYMSAGEYEDWETFSFGSVDNPLIDPLELMTARSTMSSAAFRQEFEASFEAAGGGIFQEEWIKIDKNEPKEGYYYISVDPAGYEGVDKAVKSKLKRLDETAISIVKVHQGGWWVKEIDSGRWDVQETALRILKHTKAVEAVCVGIEKGALMNALMPYLTDTARRLGIYPRIEPTTHGGQKKSARITWALQGRMEHGRIVLNEGPWTKKFISQLLDFPNPMSHDDLLDSLAYIDQVAKVNYSTLSEFDDWEPLDDIAGF